MADGYLPPVVVRLVAETAEAVAGLERFGASLEAIGVKARAAGAEIDASMAGIATSTGRVDASMTAAGASVDRFAAQATAANERTAASYTAPATAADRFAAQADADAARVAAAQDKVAASNQAMAAKMEADSAGMEAANARAVTSTEKVGTAMDGTAAKSTAAGGISSHALSMIGLAAGGVAVETVKMASTFDQKMEMLVTMAHQPQPVVDALKQKVLELGATTGQGPDKLAEALYHLTSTGMGTDQAMHALESSAKLATMGMSDLDTTAYALAGVMSAAPPDIHNTDQAVAMMASTVGQGDMKMQDLANSIKSGLLPTMIQAGMGMRDYGATLATVTDNSMPAEMAANRLRTAVLMMEKPTKAGTAALADMGMTSDQLAKDMQSGGMIQAITDLKSHMENLKPAAGDVKMSMEQVNQASQEFHDQMIQDGASADDAAKATDKYRQTLESTGTSGMRAIKDIDAAFGGSRSAGTMLLLTDEAGKLQQKYNDMGTSVQQEQQFQENWNNTTQQTAVKAQQAKAGLEALGIQIGEQLMPAVNATLGVVARFGAAITSGSTSAKIMADVIGGVLVAVIAAYTAKMVVAVAQTVAWAATGVASFMVGVARMVAGWGLLGTSAQEWAVTSRTAAAEAETANTTATEGVVAAWRTAMLEVIATIRGAGPEMAAAAGTDGEEAGAAMSTGMAEATAAGKAKVAAAGAEAGAAAGTAAKTGALSKFTRSAGEVGLVLMAVEGIAQAAGVPGPLEMVENLMGEINNYMTGEPLTPSQQAWENQFGRMSNTVREKLGLADLYSKDGAQKLNVSMTQGANDAATGFQAGMDRIPPVARESAARTVDAARTGMAGLPPAVQPPLNAMVTATARAGTDMVQAHQQAMDDMHAKSVGGFTALGQAQQAYANGTLPKLTSAEAVAAQQHAQHMDDMRAHSTSSLSAQQKAAGDYAAAMSRTMGPQEAAAAAAHAQHMDDMRAKSTSSLSAQQKAAGDYAAAMSHTMGPQEAAAAQAHQAHMDDMHAKTRGAMSQMDSDISNYAQQVGHVMTPAENKVAQDHQVNMDKMQASSRGGVSAMQKSAEDYAKQFPPPIDRGSKAAEDRVGQMPGNFDKAVAPIPGNMSTAGGNAIDGYKGGFDQKSPGVMQGIKDWFSNQIREIKGILGIASPSTVMQSVGVDFMTGLWNGMVSMMNTITTRVQDWINRTVAAIRSTLGIASPSRVMHEIGRYFMEGFHDGIVSQHQNVVAAVDNVNTAVVDRLKASQIQARDTSWAMMQGWIENGGDIQDGLALASMQRAQSQSTGHKNRWGCWVCGKDGHDPLDCPNSNQVLTLTRANSGIGVQDSTTQAGVVNHFTIQGTVLDHEGLFQALQTAALRSGQRNSFTGGFGSPR